RAILSRCLRSRGNAVPLTCTAAIDQSGRTGCPFNFKAAELDVTSTGCSPQGVGSSQPASAHPHRWKEKSSMTALRRSALALGTAVCAVAMASGPTTNAFATTELQAPTQQHTE